MDTQKVLNGMRESFIQLPMSLRLGNLASELARVRAWTGTHNQPVQDQIDICRGLIEWSAPDLLPDRVDDAARLVDIQHGLTRWYWLWNDAQNDPAKCDELAQQAQNWSDEVLKMSGLLEE